MKLDNVSMGLQRLAPMYYTIKMEQIEGRGHATVLSLPSTVFWIQTLELIVKLNSA